MSARSKARKRALDLLYASDLRGGDGAMGDPLPAAAAAGTSGAPLPEHARRLVEGVLAHRERIDELIAGHASGWTLPRMPPVDRNILRIGVYELLWCDDVPDAVAISEAVELASALSTADSPRFVNGLLGRLLARKPELIG